jgi:hypothetical protein
LPGDEVRHIDQSPSDYPQVGHRSQDFFEVDPVRFAGALGVRGLLAYRRAIEEREDGGRAFAVNWARERLAVLDRDGEVIVALLGGDLSAPHQFIQVCEAMVEVGREEEVLRWAMRGIAETDGWQVEQLYDLRAVCTSGARLCWRFYVCVVSNSSGWPRRAPMRACVALPTRWRLGDRA